MDGPTLGALKTILSCESFVFTSRECIELPDDRRFFVKTTSNRKEQFKGEFESLRLMSEAAPGLSPKAIDCKEIGDNVLFVSEYIELGRLRKADFVTLASRLASELHLYKSERGFGFDVPTYCGATRLGHGWFATWSECYSNLLSDLLSQLRSKEDRYLDLCTKCEDVRNRAIPRLLDQLKVDPVLLHGDLWSGNVALDQTSKRVVIYDPASFFGHNEADLAIARIFGGFPDSFFINYHEAMPKSEPVSEYEVRQDLYQLFHYVNHTLLFGASYEYSALKKASAVLRFVDSL